MTSIAVSVDDPRRRSGRRASRSYSGEPLIVACPVVTPARPWSFAAVSAANLERETTTPDPIEDSGIARCGRARRSNDDGPPLEGVDMGDDPEGGRAGGAPPSLCRSSRVSWPSKSPQGLSAQCAAELTPRIPQRLARASARSSDCDAGIAAHDRWRLLIGIAARRLGGCVEEDAVKSRSTYRNTPASHHRHGPQGKGSWIYERRNSRNSYCRGRGGTRRWEARSSRGLGRYACCRGLLFSDRDSDIIVLSGANGARCAFGPAPRWIGSSGRARNCVVMAHRDTHLKFSGTLCRETS